MEKIKFKVWDKKNKIMFPNKNYLVDFSMNLKGEWEIIREGVLGYKENEKQNDFIFRQFTGLKDKNGKEIYKGDIVEFIYKVGDKIRCQVKWNKELCKFQLIGKDFTLDLIKSNSGYEVIGNIYKNPELMELEK